MQFFLPMIVPTVTAQQKGARIIWRNGEPKIQFYEKPEVTEARAKFTAALTKHRPNKPLNAPVVATVKICYLATDKHPHGTPHINYPDVDNSPKLFIDVLEDMNFLVNDKHICLLTLAKGYSNTPGIYVELRSLTEG